MQSTTLPHPEIDPSPLNTHVLEIPLESIVVFDQVRKQFDKNESLSLAVSIVRDGQLQPLLVSPLEGGKFRLICGERRLQALKIMEKSHAYVRVIPMPAPEVILRIQLQENLARQNLSLIEQTQGILDLLALELKMSHEETHIALVNAFRNPGDSAVETFFTRLTRPTLNTFYVKHLPLLRLPEEVQESINRREISAVKALAQQREERTNTSEGNDAPRVETLSQRVGALRKRLKTISFGEENEKVAMRLLAKLEAYLDTLSEQTPSPSLTQS